MALEKKATIVQRLVVMVGKTDFATVQSALGTDSDFNSKATQKVFQYNQGVSTAAGSATLSKLTRQVRSGIWQVTLNATETNFDRVLVMISHPSCAVQYLDIPLADFDDSDIMSRLSDFYSDFQSRVPKAVATNSQLSDLHSDLRSFLVVMSDVLSDFYSDFQSRVPKRVATDSQLSDLHSDLRSYLVGLSDQLSDTYSKLNVAISNVESAIDSQYAASPDNSDIASAVLAEFGLAGVSYSDLSSKVTKLASRVTKEVAYKSQLSDLHSDLKSYLAGMSDVLSDFYSDFQSRVPKRVATDSQLSDLASDIKSIITVIKASTDNLPSAVKKNTQLANFEFLMVDTNGAPVTGLGAAVTATRSIDGAAFGACANAVAEVSAGIYKITLAAGDVNGDVITLRFTGAGCRDRFVTIVTKP